MAKDFFEYRAAQQTKVDKMCIRDRSSKSTVLPAMAVMYVWKEAGYLMVFFLSGIQSISDEVMEAARIDGAGNWTVFRRITMPLLAPTFLFVSTIAFTRCV